MSDTAESQRPGNDQPAHVLTISASYGAGGSVIAPQLAATLGLPFVDRLLRRELATEASRASDAGVIAGRGDSSWKVAASSESVSEEEAGSSAGGRFISYLARAAAAGAMVVSPEVFDDDADLRRYAERPCLAALEHGGAVILGRAAAVALAGRPHVYHVRLDGPAERRAALAATLEETTLEKARERLRHTDRSRELWVRRLYRADPRDTGWYHLVLDTTVLRPERSVELIATAAREFWSDI